MLSDFLIKQAKLATSAYLLFLCDHLLLLLTSFSLSQDTLLLFFEVYQEQIDRLKYLRKRQRDRFKKIRRCFVFWLTIDDVRLDVCRAEHDGPIDASEEQEGHFSDIFSPLQNFYLPHDKYQPSQLLDIVGGSNVQWP